MSPYLHGVPAPMLRTYLAPGWDDMTMNEKIIWILRRARARAAELDQPELEWVSINTLLDLKLYTYRNRISEKLRPEMRLQGLDIEARTVEVNSKRIWAWRLTEYSDQRELKLGEAVRG
jgi:hypothetical protein